MRRAPKPVAARENFPVALRVLPRRIRTDLMALYGYARFVDDLGDEDPGDPRVAQVDLADAGSGGARAPADRIIALDAFESGVRALYRGVDPGYPVLRALAPTARGQGLPIEPLLRLIEANRVDQTTTRCATFDQLVEYCTLSANPVGELVLYVFDQVSPERLALSDRICTALQIIEHLQDLGEDHRRGRVYLPKEDMDSFGVTEADLARRRAPQPLRDLVSFETERARAWLDAGAPLVSCLAGWGRLAAGGYVAGGRAALRALERCGYDTMAGAPKAGRRTVAWQWLLANVRSAG